MFHAKKYQIGYFEIWQELNENSKCSNNSISSQKQEFAKLLISFHEHELRKLLISARS